MKRHPNLQDLSRDHHHALLLARRAEKTAETGSDDEVASMWESIAHSFDSDLGPHFEVEEQQLLPLLEAAGEHELVGRTRSDHERLRALRAQAGDERGRLERFGELLREHVRFEESELFPTAEKVLDPSELVAVAKASAATPTAVQRADGRAKKGSAE